MRMVEGRRRPDAHELLDADGDHRHAGIVLEMGDDVVGHVVCFRDIGAFSWPDNSRPDRARRG